MVLNNGVYTDAVGTRYWYVDGQIHREGAPAVINLYGSEYWYIEGAIYFTEASYALASRERLLESYKGGRLERLWAASVGGAIYSPEFKISASGWWIIGWAKDGPVRHFYGPSCKEPDEVISAAERAYSV